MNEFGLNSTGVEPSTPTGEKATTHAASSPLGTHDSTVIVGLDGREHDADALALGSVAAGVVRGQASASARRTAGPSR